MPTAQPSPFTTIPAHLLNIHICSFGTWTREKNYCTDASKKMRATMWPRNATRRQKDTLDHDVAREAVTAAYSEEGVDIRVVHFFKCRSLQGGREDHCGAHPEVMAEYLEPPNAYDLDWIFKQLGQLLPFRKRDCTLLAFWCNAGEYRSVACSVAVRDWLQAALGVHIPLMHLCQKSWRAHHLCGCCTDCDPDNATDARHRITIRFRERISRVIKLELPPLM